MRTFQVSNRVLYTFRVVIFILTVVFSGGAFFLLYTGAGVVLLIIKIIGVDLLILLIFHLLLGQFVRKIEMDRHELAITFVSKRKLVYKKDEFFIQCIGVKNSQYSFVKVDETAKNPILAIKHRVTEKENGYLLVLFTTGQLVQLMDELVINEWVE